MYNVFFIFGRFSLAGKLPKWPKIPFQYPLALRYPKILEKSRKHHQGLVSVRNRLWPPSPPAKADIATAILTNVIEHLVLLLPPNKHAFTAKAVWADLSVQDGTELFVPKDAGPWVITMVVQGPTTSAYGSHLRMQLKVNTAWPKSPAEVRVHSWIHSPFVKQNGVMDEAAMAEALGTLDADVSPLCRTVQAAVALLNNPSRFCEDDTDSADDATESNKERLDVILKYKVQREHDWLFDPKRAYSAETIHPEYWKAYCLNTPEAWAALVTTEATEIYSVPLFKPELCKAFVEELDKFHGTGLPARRPNSMNNYGIVVNEIGMEPALDQLCHNLLQPLAQYLFPGGFKWRAALNWNPTPGPVFRKVRLLKADSNLFKS